LRLYTETTGDAFNIVNGYVPLAALNGADVRAMQARALRQCLLGYAQAAPFLSDAARK